MRKNRVARKRKTLTFDALEGRVALATTLAAGSMAGLHRPAEVRTSGLEYTRVGVVGGVPSLKANQTVTLQIGLGASGRTGIYHAVQGKISLYANGVLVGTANTSGTYTSPYGDTYGVATFKYKVPASAARGSVITFSFTYAGDSTHGPASGTLSLKVN